MPCACQNGWEVLRHICQDAQDARFILSHSASRATLAPSYQQNRTMCTMNGSMNLTNTFSPDLLTNSEYHRQSVAVLLLMSSSFINLDSQLLL